MKQALFVVLLASLLVACEGTHRSNFTEGNVIELQTINGIEVGMSKSEVAKLMGTPVYENLFRKDRWIYINHIRKQNEHRTEQIFLDFSNDKLTNISKG